MTGPISRARLVIEADADDDGIVETGVFTFVGDLEITASLRTGFIAGGRGASTNAVFSKLVEEFGGETDSPSQRRGVFLDLGGGQRTVQIEFTGWEGAEADDGTLAQWGATDSKKRTKASATGQDPRTQIDVLTKYLEAAQIDSRNPATLEYGEYSESGLYDPVDVVVEGPEQRKTPQDPSAFTGTLTLLAAADVQEYRDALVRDGT